MALTDRILVTGGVGFIGTHLCRELRSSGRGVVCLDLRQPESPVKGVEYVQGDVRNASLVQGLIGHVGAVVHLAATVSIPVCQKDPVESYSNNFGATLTVLEELRKQRVAGRTVGVVFAS